jgi:hypothetical protein
MISYDKFFWGKIYETQRGCSQKTKLEIWKLEIESSKLKNERRGERRVQR